AQAMLRPSADVVRTHGIPAAVIAEAYTRNPRHGENTLAALANLRGLCCEIGIVTPWSVRLWRAAGIWQEERDGDCGRCPRTRARRAWRPASRPARAGPRPVPALRVPPDRVSRG